VELSDGDEEFADACATTPPMSAFVWPALSAAEAVAAAVAAFPAVLAHLPEAQRRSRPLYWAQ
jgi:hypothetical protein